MAPPPMPPSRLAQRLLSSLSPRLSPQVSSHQPTSEPSRFLLSVPHTVPSSSTPGPSPRPPPTHSLSSRPPAYAWDDYQSIFSSPPVITPPPPAETVDELDDGTHVGARSSSPAMDEGASTPHVELSPSEPTSSPAPTPDALAHALLGTSARGLQRDEQAEGLSVVRDAPPHLLLPTPNFLANPRRETRPFVHLPNSPALDRPAPSSEDDLAADVVLARHWASASRLNKDVVVDTTPRVTIHNLPGTALPADVQLLLLEILGGDWAGLPSFSFVTSPAAPITTSRVVSVRTVSLAQHYTLLHALASPTSAPLFAHASTTTSAGGPSTLEPTKRRVGGNLVWATDPYPDRTAASFVQLNEFEGNKASGPALEDPREPWEIPDRERRKYIDEHGGRHLLLRNVRGDVATRSAVQSLLWKEGISGMESENHPLIVRTFPSREADDESQIIHIIIPRQPQPLRPASLATPRPAAPKPQSNRLYRPISTLSPTELATRACPVLGDQPVWISETTEEEVRQLQQLKDNTRTDELRNSSRKHKVQLKGSKRNSDSKDSVLIASMGNKTITLDSPATSVATAKKDDRERYLPPTETFADWYKPAFQAFKALRLFQLSRKPSWPGSSNLLTSFFPSHQPLPSFFLPTSLFSSRHSSTTTSTSRYIPPIYKALLLPIFYPDQQDPLLAPAALPQESRTRLEHKVYLGGFPTLFQVGELRMWLMRRSLTVGEWTNVIRVVPTREERREPGTKFERRPESARKDWEMEEWEGKRWWEASGKTGVEKMTQMGSWAPANFIVTVPSEADAQRVVRELNHCEYIPPRITGGAVRGKDSFFLEARILPTE